MSSLSQHAYHYTERLGLGLVPIPQGMKGPRTAGWNHPENTIRTGEGARQTFGSRPLNMGVLHSVSDTGTLDVDMREWAALALQTIGIDLGQFDDWAVRIKGRQNEKPFFQMGGRQWERRALAWPHPTEKQKDKEGNPTEKPVMVTLFELRSGSVQDVLPPSIHPDTGLPYEWVGTKPRSRDDIPMIPGVLIDLWENWEQHAAQMREACPWREVLPRPAAPTYSEVSLTPKGERAGDHYRAGVHVSSVLIRNGYEQHGPRFTPPGSKSAAGVRLLKGEDGIDRVFSDHGSCALADGHAHDSFSALAILEHGGDFRSAARAAAAEMNLPPLQTPSENSPALPELTPEQVQGLWEEHSTALLESVSAVLAPHMHHRALSAIVDLTAWVYQSAAEGHLTRTLKGEWAVQVGGIKGFAALLGCHPSDLRARLDFLSDRGMLRTARINPEDPKSGVQILLPADPLTLPFLAQVKEGSKSVERPQTREVRKAREFIRPPSKTAQLHGGRIKKLPSLRALSRVALILSQHPGMGLRDLAARLNMRLPTLRRKVSELGELGYLTEGGALRCAFREFFQDMRAEEGEAIYHRVDKVLDERKDYFTRRLLLARLGITEDAEVPSIRRRLARTERQIERLGDGEAPHMVLGRAS